LFFSSEIRNRKSEIQVLHHDWTPSFRPEMKHGGRAAGSERRPYKVQKDFSAANISPIVAVHFFYLPPLVTPLVTTQPYMKEMMILSRQSNVLVNQAACIVAIYKNVQYVRSWI
jgi:hypothetical protein